MNGKVFINSIYGRCAHVDVCSSIKDNRQKCGFYLEQRPHGEWVFKNGKYRCSICLEPCATFCMNEPRDNFCLYCGSDNRREGE